MICNKCNAKKDDSADFYANDRTCKECRKEKVRQNRRANIEYYRAYDRKRGNRQGIEYVRKYRAENEAKYKAHTKVNNAIRSGELNPEPCEMCGISETVHAHHDDYAKPLNVRWLCAKHHRQWHIEYGEAANG